MFFRHLVFLILFPCAITHAQTKLPFQKDSYSSRKLQELALKYIGQNVFTTPFTEVVEVLVNDPEARIDTSIAHTDTSKFYLRAYRNKFNPFDAPLDSVKTIFAEVVRREKESKSIMDTVFYLQTVGVAKGKAQVQNLRTAFSRMDKEIRADFNHYRYEKSKNKKDVSGEFLSYYRLGYPKSPVSISWKELTPETGVIVITLIVELLEHPSDRM
jgi:hypothetical protein